MFLSSLMLVAPSLAAFAAAFAFATLCHWFLPPLVDLRPSGSNTSAGEKFPQIRGITGLHAYLRAS